MEGEEGVWVYYGHDNGWYVHSIHATEIEALRALNDNGYDRVGFVPFGMEFNDAIRKWEEQRRSGGKVVGLGGS